MDLKPVELLGGSDSDLNLVFDLALHDRNFGVPLIFRCLDERLLDLAPRFLWFLCVIDRAAHLSSDDDHKAHHLDGQRRRCPC